MKLKWLRRRRSRPFPEGDAGVEELCESLLLNGHHVEERIREMALDMVDARRSGMGRIPAIAWGFGVVRDDKAWTRDELCVFLAFAISMLPEVQTAGTHEDTIDNLVEFFDHELSQCRESAVDGVCQRHAGRLPDDE